MKEDPTALVMKSTNFWDITPCSPLRVNRRFGETYRLHLQGRKKEVEQETSVKAGGKLAWLRMKTNGVLL
jgi:hypothetical protein